MRFAETHKASVHGDPNKKVQTTSKGYLSFIKAARTGSERNRRGLTRLVADLEAANSDVELTLAKTNIFFQHGDQADTPRAIRARRDSPDEKKTPHLDEGALASTVATIKTNLGKMLASPTR